MADNVLTIRILGEPPPRVVLFNAREEAGEIRDNESRLTSGVKPEPITRFTLRRATPADVRRDCAIRFTDGADNEEKTPDVRYRRERSAGC